MKDALEPLPAAREIRHFPAEVLRRRVGDLAGKKVLVIGDIMLDAYLYGDATRISPEAPVPVVRVEEERRLLGGAGNVARNIRALGGRPTLVSVTGADDGGRELTRLARDLDVPHVFLESPARRTTTKTRLLARRQQVARIDREHLEPVAGAELERLFGAIEQHLPAHEVIILSDYGKGLVSPAFIAGLEERRTRLAPDARVLVDPKSPNFGLYGQMFLMTPNLKETEEAANMSVASFADLLSAGRAILTRYGCPHVLSTLGPQGMALFAAHDSIWRVPTMAKSVFDVTGAGDTVIATLGLGLAAGLDIFESCLLANCAAGLVVGKVGAATVTPEELGAALGASPALSMERCD